LTGPPPVAAAGPAGEDNALRFGGFVAEEKQFLGIARFSQVAAVEAGTRYRAALRIKNIVDNRNHAAWADKALFTLNITWLKDNEPIHGQHSHSLRVWDAILNWEDVQVTGTAPTRGQRRPFRD